MALYKVVLLGVTDVGKSSTFVRFKTGKFEEDLTTTIGLDQTIQDVTYLKDEKDPDTENTVQVQLWDTAGLERAGRMTNNYYKNSHGIILMYDVTDLSSLSHLRHWFDDAKLYAPAEVEHGRKTLYFIVGNKIDVSSGEIEVSEDRAERFLKDAFSFIPESQIFRMSVKSGLNFDKLFSQIAKTLAEQVVPTVPNQDIKMDLTSEKDSCGC